MKKVNLLNQLLVFFLINFIFSNYLLSYSYASKNALNQVSGALNIVIQKIYSSEDEDNLRKIEKCKALFEIYQEKINVIPTTLVENRYSISGYPLGKFLFALVKRFNPKIILEIGTYLGLSTSYFAASLESNRSGTIITLEDCNSLVSLTKKSLNILNHNALIMDGDIESSLNSILSKHSFIDMVFYGGFYKKNFLLKNFNQIYPFFSDCGLCVLNEIDFNQDLREAWEFLKFDKRINLTISITLGIPYLNMLKNYKSVYQRIGLGFILKNSEEKMHFDITIDSLDFCKGIFFNGDKFIVLKK